MIGPDTYVPSCTVITGFTVPVAVTDRTIGPSVTLAVTIFGAVVLPVRKYQPPTIATSTIASIQALFFDNFIDAQLLSCRSPVSSNYPLLDVPPLRRFRGKGRHGRH